MDRRVILNLVVAVAVIAFVFNAGVWGFWAFVAVCAYVVVRLLMSIADSYRKYRRKGSGSKREYVVKLTAKLMAVFFVTGTVLFTFTFRTIGSIEDVDFNNTELIVRSMMCSLDMFMLGVDSNILDRLDHKAFLKSVLMVQAALSFLCTMALLVSLVYSRFKAYYVLHRRTKITPENNHLYIFFGLNENSQLLAKDIHTNDKKALTLFVDTSEIEENESSSWDNIISLFTHRQKTFDFAKESDSLVTIASKQLCDLDGDLLKKNDVDVFSLLGIEKVGELIESLVALPEGGQLHIFFLSDDEDNNILNLINLAKDTTILNVAERSSSHIIHKIYCHARYNGPNRVVEDLAVRKGLNVEIVDSSHLAVELLKSKGENHPVRVAHLSKDYPTTVTGPLDALIVGFGEVGRDAFRYIYEYGTFIEVKDGRPEVAKPAITAIDAKMNGLKGLFEANTPAINYEDGNITLKQMSYTEVDFFKECLSEKRCRSLNYIVIALGDDDQNISLATVIFNRIRRYRDDMSHLIIMVRCVKDEKREMMEKIAEHYNRGCGEEDAGIIRLFGNPEEVYSYDIIIKDELTRRGKLFLENYRRLKGEGKEWDKRRSELTGMDKRKSGEIVYPNIDKLRKLRRQESQDLSNTLHIDTKMWLLEQSLGQDYDWKSFLERFFDETGNSTMNGKMAEINYPGLYPEENKIMIYLAQLEHARWNAAHELLGYVVNTKESSCNERYLRHNCLRDWTELDKESKRASCPGWDCDYKAYDFCVVDSSIAIYFDEVVKNGIRKSFPDKKKS